MQIPNLTVIDRRSVWRWLGLGFAVFLCSIFILLSYLIEQELETQAQAQRLEHELFTVGLYVCKNELDYILAPARGDKYTFVCNDGTRSIETVIIHPITPQPEVDYAID
jgi:hypothetical protein